jgi:hypothetical protein
MRVLPLFLVLLMLPFAACTTKTAATGDDAATSDDAAADIDQDATVTAPPQGYTAKFRAKLANKAPAAQEEGERIFFEETWGTETHGEYPPAAFLVQLWQGDTAKWGEQFSNYGFLVDPGDDLPVGLKRGQQDPTLVHDTCAACHTAKLPDGRIWAGMPATGLAMAAFKVDLHDAWVKAGNKAYASAAQIGKWQETQPGSLDVTGEADATVFNDFPMYVDLHKMKHLNILGSGNDLKTEVYLSLHGFVDPGPFPPDEADAALVGYFAVLDAPQAPSPTDTAAVTRGRKVFVDNQCIACHRDDLSNDAADWVDGPEILPGVDKKNHEFGTIATSGAFFQSATGSGGGGGGGPGPGLMDLIQFLVDHGLSVANPTGYVPSNLHGLWATAPYLHNGSVPTLPDLLKPAVDRPKTFVRGGHTVDTSKPGLSNQGHGFGTTLPETDKADLVAYLLSL